MDAYDQAKHTARVFLSEARARRDSVGYWFSVNGAESALRRAMGLNPRLQRLIYPRWATSLGMVEGVTVACRETGRQFKVIRTMGVYMEIHRDGMLRWVTATEYTTELSRPIPRQGELFA